MTRHKNEERIENALKLDRKKRVEDFQKIKRDGIVCFNREEVKKENPSLQGERARRKYFELTKCSACNGFISKRFFFVHRKYCSAKYDGPIIALPTIHEKLPDTVKLSDLFKKRILSTLRNDAIGKISMMDATILMVGSKLFRKLEMKREKRSSVDRSVRSDMRSLGSVYVEFKQMGGVQLLYGTCTDMFLRVNIGELFDSIDIVTYKEDKTLKAGLRQNLFYLIKKAGKIIQAFSYMKGDEELASSVEKFLICFDASEDELVSGARYQLEKNSLIKRRKPCNLPLEKDVKALSEHTVKRMKEMCSDFYFWTSHSFVELRNIICTRLTLINGRRGGETGRLLLSEWREAERDGWIDAQRFDSLNEEDKALVKALKITYMAGKGNRHLVSILIPDDTMAAMKKIANPEVRKGANVLQMNEFLFASTKMSEVHVSGWHALKDVCNQLVLTSPELINATNNRHRISTIFATMSVPSYQRELFYKHMGHSEEMNANVYQAPLALMAVKTFGKNLMAMDKG